MVKIMLFRESLCHLMGLQHIFNNDVKYLGGKGYKKIQEESITVETLKKHNKKQYNFIKERLRHFDKIIDVLRYGKMICFNEEKVKSNTYIKADFIIYDKKRRIYFAFIFKERVKYRYVYTNIIYCSDKKRYICK